MRRAVAVLFFLILCCYCNLAHHFVPSNVESESDMQSLVAFKSCVTSDPSNFLANWVPSIHFCNWTGVSCHSALQRVQSLNLSGAGLEGSISPSIGNLSFMTHLDLASDTFKGEIPKEFGRLGQLKVLDLTDNRLQGAIPKNLTACKELEILSLQGNNLTGSIPPEMGRLPNLKVLVLFSNYLTGNIPSSLANLSYLESLNLGRNNLRGHITPELGRLAHLKWLIIFDNPRLKGPVPLSFSNMSNLEQMVLFNNSLTGSIPPELGKLTQLRLLYLWGNNLTGSIPSTLSNCSQLSKVDLGENHLSGVVPSELSQLSQLQYLFLCCNQLVSGSATTIPIVRALANRTLLNELELLSNQLTGRLPEELPRNLSTLLLYDNHITGIIPPQIANLSNLTDLDLSYNFITGRIPSSLGSLQKLQRLWLDNNKLEGSIPKEIGKITNLGLLSASYNMLSGEIPDTIAHLQQIRTLVLHHNKLSGNIPVSLGKCYRLELLDLSSNQFKGSLPPEVVNLRNLQIYFNLSKNSLEGPLPPEIGSMINVQAIDISENRLNGKIPGALGGCQELQYLKLSSNAFQGSIPQSFCQLKSLVDIDLSFNNLTGSIPASLNALGMLEHLNLSFNNLTGEIPKQGVFKKLTVLSFKGNPLLCGEWMHLPACPIVSTGKNDMDKIQIIAPIVGFVVFISCILLLWRLIYRRRNLHLQRNSDFISTVKLNDQMPVSYGEIARATDGFNQQNLLGTGSFASVYKGILNDGTVAAVKLLNLQVEKASKSFVAECRVLGKVRHRNLVKILTFCSEFGQKILVLQFMTRGNLEKMLLSRGNVLSFRDILNIAIDVICGLEYLHHDCFVQVVHCDIKPSNILLDEDMTAHLADFGISQVIYGQDSAESMALSLGLKGSIGYIPPEYGIGGKVSTKGDIYSYGVLLLEMITKKRPTHPMFVGDLNLHRWVLMNFPSQMEDTVDKNLLEDAEIEKSIVPFVRIALECSKENPEERPTAREVGRALETIRMHLQ